MPKVVPSSHPAQINQSVTHSARQSVSHLMNESIKLSCVWGTTECQHTMTGSANTLDGNLCIQISVLVTTWVTWLPIITCELWSLIILSSLLLCRSMMMLSSKVVNSCSTGWCIVILYSSFTPICNNSVSTA